MTEHGAMALTTEILSRSDLNEGLFLSGLELGIALMEGGNEQVQDRCHEILAIPGGHPFLRSMLARINEGMSSLETTLDDQGDEEHMPPQSDSAMSSPISTSILSPTEALEDRHNLGVAPSLVSDHGITNQGIETGGIGTHQKGISKGSVP